MAVVCLSFGCLAFAVYVLCCCCLVFLGPCPIVFGYSSSFVLGCLGLVSVLVVSISMSVVRG